ncbi:MAG: CBS domain-containing protein, partial [Eudoraea sp.]|nr:CBS domain-containing protein [Eudoraea sp.]
MGELNVKKLSASSDRIEYIAQLVGDIEALDRMLKEGMFEKSPLHVGAEQEFCLVNEVWNPTNKADEVLAEINDDHFTNELTRY